MHLYISERFKRLKLKTVINDPKLQSREWGEMYMSDANWNESASDAITVLLMGKLYSIHECCNLSVTLTDVSVTLVLTVHLISVFVVEISIFGSQLWES